MTYNYEDVPFLSWLNSVLYYGCGEIHGRDIVLTKFGSKRFSLGVVTDGNTKGYPVLGVNLSDAEAIMSIKWTSAGIIGGQDNKDWIALSCKDIRPSDPEISTPYPIRLWINFPLGSLDKFMTKKPPYMEIRKAKNGKKGLPISEKAYMMRLPLMIRNNWIIESE